MITNILCVILGVSIKEIAQTLIESKIKEPRRINFITKRII